MVPVLTQIREHPVMLAAGTEVEAMLAAAMLSQHRDTQFTAHVFKGSDCLASFNYGTPRGLAI